jgi:AcrR family transcriptional regulator
MARIPKTDREETLNATRQRLLEAALAEFARKGFAEANINHISEAAGFSKGTVYNYFSSKQALMLALVTEAGAVHVGYIEEQVRAVSDPAQRLVRFYEAGFRFVEEHPAQARFLITTLYSPGVELQEAMYRAYQPMFHLVAQEILAPGIEQGVFRAVDLLTTANLLMTVYLGTGSHVDEQGKVFMDPHLVADFALHALAVDVREGAPWKVK